MRLDNLSERQQVVAIILMAGLVIFALWFFLLLPQNRQRKRLERDIAQMRSQLAQKNYLVGEEALMHRRSQESNNYLALHGDWEALVERVTGFTNRADGADSQYGRIDFKVALFDVRQRLLAKSRSLRIALPHDLGMGETVDSDEDARRLMLQLRTVEKLVDLALDLKIDQLRDVQPLKPVEHSGGKKQDPYFEEYPVRVRFFGNLENVYALFQAILEPGQVFSMRRLRIASAPREKAGLLEVEAVLSALLFTRSPEELKTVSAVQQKAAYGRGF